MIQSRNGSWPIEAAKGKETDSHLATPEGM